MTIRLVPLDEAHAGDLIGYTQRGRPIFLPGGGAPRDGEIVADDGDDEPDGFDEPDDDEPDAPTKPDRGPSNQDLQAQLAKLQAAVRRNNQELAKRRRVGQWMADHNIDDLDAWLADLGVDKTTGQPAVKAPASTAPAPASESAPSTPLGGFDEAEVERRVQLRLEQEAAQSDDVNDILRGTLAASALEIELGKIGFRGKMGTALRVADLAGISVADDGTVSGAEAAAASLKEEIPEWFKAPQARNGPIRVGGEDVDGGNKSRPAPVKDSWEKRVVEQLRGR